MEIDIRQAVLDNCSYGLYVVTSHRDGKLNGQISDALMQVTACPPTVAVSINKTELTHEYIAASGAFAVSVLSRQADMAFIGHFGFHSGRDLDKFDTIPYKPGKTGCPLVEKNAVAVFEAKVISTLDLGTHTLFVGEVLDGEELSGERVLTYHYYQQHMKGKASKNAPSYHEEKKTDLVAVGDGKYACDVCGYIYDPAKGDPDHGIKPGTKFEDIPEGWVCPVCGVGKDEFSPCQPVASATGKYICETCGWVYDPAKGDPQGGVAPGIKFSDLPDDWVCPVCRMGKGEFAPLEK